MGTGGSVGVLAPFVGGTYYGSLVAGTVAAAASHGRPLIAIQTLDAAADLTVSGGNPAFDAPVAWDHIGGYVVFADAVDAGHLRRLGRAGKPVVLVGHTVDGLDRPVVLADNDNGMRAAVTHLIRAHGCSRIAFTGFLEASDIRERYEAYLAVLREHGLTPGPLLPATSNVEVGIEWTADDLLRDGKPDALVAATDRNAIGAQRMLAASGLHCPDDYQLTGFDDLDVAAFVRPELASVAQPLDAMSRLGVDLLVREMRGEAVRRGEHRLPTRFVPRTSCGCTAFAERLPDLPEADPRRRLAARLAGVMVFGSRLDPDATAVLVADALEAGVVVPAAHELQTLLAASPTQETLRVLCRAVQEYAGAAPVDPRGVQDIVMFLGRSYNRLQLGDQLHLRSLISVNYDLSITLLHRRDADPGDPSWLALTPATAGSIALRDRNGDLVRTPGWRRHPGPPIPAGPTTVEAFPPVELLDIAGPTFVVRAKVGDSDRGWLALVDKVENRVDDGRELVNQCAALLTVALDLREQEAQLRWAAQSDRLTGLPNRTSFTAALPAAVGHPGAVLFLDLDGFKKVNDTLGHHAGDELLTRVAARLRQCLRPTDLAARFGGDEFVILLTDSVPGPDQDQLVERLRATISAPYRIGDRTARIGVSIGVADCATGTSAEQLLRDADTAMYRVKAARRVPAAGELVNDRS
ncbi:substrate-binding and GGDEF domain-containing protein [Paractinoplanes lichenicola]|uniref:GGDEF domain-containing protein n=1 Tax=Paractinoplanes lichenicola TaxID=2802976 RepID=A0ABS1VLI4_9ACTN|nr:GGDEF domain-containing protein [Actinoplanes lichenicola]MBL7255577.1 GGDEF domain-containing protein [Actinoplanes lichenicola]